MTDQHSRLTPAQSRYDSFQERAVSHIVSDFTLRPDGRFLLVIPTGGGKTFTAVKAVNELYDRRVLDPDQDRTLWTAHRKELLAQANLTFQRFVELYPHKPSFSSCIDFHMISAASGFLKDGSSKVRLVVVDEAHHAALKNVNYSPLFEAQGIGILGLTATPSRHDGAPLEFDRESFSIGFPDLVKLGIVLRPEVRKVEGGTFDIDSLNDDVSLETLNTFERNQQIIEELERHPEDYRKVIIYVGTLKHVKALFRQLLDSRLAEYYDSIAFVSGAENSRNQERADFFAQEKSYRCSILVNVMVLSEGYDDPSVNTVVMATPSHSKLYYMQAMGRAIRHDPEDPAKTAFCVEIDDTLPNIRYRIDNRWLFSDVSDALEPVVIDRNYENQNTLHDRFRDLYEEFDVPNKDRVFPPYHSHDRYTMLLFKRYAGPEQYKHFALVVTNGKPAQSLERVQLFIGTHGEFQENGAS